LLDQAKPEAERPLAIARRALHTGTVSEAPTIRITVDGKPACTVDQAATRHNLRPVSVRALISRAGDTIAPAAMLDGRTPLYHVAAIDKLIKSRSGRGRTVQR
jgi:hypothetical protein